MNKTLADILRSYIPDGDGYNSEYAHNLNAAADALESQQSTPAGYVMVPVKPTPEMLDCIMEWQKIGNVTAYRALLAAAPKSEQPPVQEPVAWLVSGGDGRPKTYEQYPEWAVGDAVLVISPLYAAPQPVSDDAVRGLVEALEVLAKLGNGEHYGNSDGNVIAQEALATYRAAMGSNGDE